MTTRQLCDKYRKLLKSDKEKAKLFFEEHRHEDKRFESIVNLYHQFRGILNDALEKCGDNTEDIVKFKKALDETIEQYFHRPKYERYDEDWWKNGSEPPY